MHVFQSRFLTFSYLCLVFFVIPLSAFAEEDKTLSPYFVVLSQDEGAPRMPLEGTEVNVDVAGVIADVRVKQVYQNTGATPIEAIYVFPGSTRAAVYGMKMTIGDRVRIAKIKEKQAAKAAYKKAKKEGKSASLLEQKRPNVFQMKVANIMPGDRIVVELSYTELLVPEDGLYEFVYPTVVGPRFSDMPASQATPEDSWVSNPYLCEGEKPTSTFDIKINVSTGIDLKELVSPSHQVDIQYSGKSKAQIALLESERFSGNKDYILRYRLEGGKIESGALLFEGKDENFFLLMMQPPKRVQPKDIPAREYIFIVDVSGSMHGFPIDTAKALFEKLLRGLRPKDSFNMLLFAGGSQALSGYSLPATKSNVNRGVSFLGSQRGGGGTQLLPALQRGLALPKDEGTSRTFVIITDGYVHVEAEAFDFIRENLGNANFFSFGIGSSVNRHLIEGMARVGEGHPFVLTNPKEAASTASRFHEYISSPVLTGIGVKYEGLEVYDVEPFRVPDLFSEKPIVAFGKWKGEPKGRITVQGFRGEGYHQETLTVSAQNVSPSHAALRYLWAREKIRELSDYNRLQHDPQRKDQIIELGLKYNLLSQYTSFIAVDDVVRNKSGKLQSVKQPLPLPEGVSKFAVGGGVPTVPEPETYLLMLVLSLFLGTLAVFHRQELSARLRANKK